MTMANFGGAVLRPAGMVVLAFTASCFALDPATAILEETIAQQRADALPATEAYRLYEAGQFLESIAFFDLALEDDPQNERLIFDRLVARHEAGELSEDERELLAILHEERAAEIELVVRAVRLRTLKAKSLMLQGRNRQAVTIADDLLEEVNRLPEGVDRDVLVAEIREIANQATGRRTARQKQQTPNRYKSGQPNTSVEERIARNTERLIEEGETRQAYKSDEAQQLLEVERSRQIPSELLTFPEDWLEKTERRKQYADGTIYKGKPFRDADGELRYTAIYDLRNLMHIAPDFVDSPEMNLDTVNRNVADRYALQWRSQIYGGYAQDLAAGAPLLQFFGGLDEARIPPSEMAADRRYQEIMRLVDKILNAGADGNGP